MKFGLVKKITISGVNVAPTQGQGCCSCRTGCFGWAETLQTMDSKACLKKPRGQQWHKDNAGVGDTERGKNLAAEDACRRTLCY